MEANLTLIIVFISAEVAAGLILLRAVLDVLSHRRQRLVSADPQD